RVGGVDRPERGDRHAGDVLQADEVTRRLRALQLRIRASMGAGEIRVACGVGPGDSQRQVVVEAAGGGRQSAPEDAPTRGKRGRGAGVVVVVVGGPAQVPSAAQASNLLNKPRNAPQALPFLHVAGLPTIEDLPLPFPFAWTHTAG